MGISWSQSGTIARDNNDVRATGALAYFYVGGTTTPLVVYENAAESTPHDNPVEADSNGRWPNVFIPYCTSYDVQVTTSGGTVLFYFLEIPNPDPVDVAAGAVTTSSTQLFQTGMMVFEPKTGTKTGWVRANGRTLGDASSGGTERANADASDLFAYLWNNFANGICAVSTGRGISATADFGAHKTITLFDLRGGTIFGVDDMGNSAGSFMTSVTFATGSSTTGGSAMGENTHALITAELASHSHTVGTIAAAAEAAHTHTGTTGTESATHTHDGSTLAGVAASGGIGDFLTNSGAAQSTATSGGGDRRVTNQVTSPAVSISGSTGTQSANHTHSFTSSAGSSHTHTMSGSVASAGSGTAHNNVSKGITGNWLIKI